MKSSFGDPYTDFLTCFSALRGRVYLPQDELAQFGICDDDILSMRVTDKWREFMKQQIKRARFYFKLAEKGASELDKSSRWPVCLSHNYLHSTKLTISNNLLYGCDPF